MRDGPGQILGDLLTQLPSLATSEPRHLKGEVDGR